MSWLSDAALERLRATLAEPDLEDTRYRLLEPIGRGGMGTVWLALDARLDRKVALKVLDLGDASTELAERLVREAKVLARLEHPGIVPVHDVGTLRDGRVYYAMKWLAGESLDQASPKLALGDRIRVFRRVLDAVAFAHDHGVVHRDIKPANIVVGIYGEVLVVDWGLAKVLARENPIADASSPIATRPGAVTTAHGAVLGTPGWMAPEQLRGENDAITTRSDVYALGALLDYLLAGVEAPRPLRAVAAKARRDDPALRYPDAAALAAEIDRWLDREPVLAHREALLERAARLFRRHRTAIVLILTYLVVRALLLLRAR